MYITISTQYNFDVRAHATAQEAVTYLLQPLDSDYANDFWADENGTDIKRGRRMIGFDLVVYPSAAAAIKSVLDLDEDFLPPALQALAAAIQDGLNSGLEG